MTRSQASLLSLLVRFWGTGSRCEYRLRAKCILRELISLVMHILNKPIEVAYKPARDFDVPANVLDITRARSLLCWSPKISFEEGLSRRIAYLRQQLVGYLSDLIN
jgi:nucleoside-diphosphate-sugar epimerase